MKKYKVAFATGSRADYGIVRNYIAKLNEDPEIDFSILTTGALLASEFGSAIDIIEKDGFNVDFKNKVEQKVDIYMILSISWLRYWTISESSFLKKDTTFSSYWETAMKFIQFP